MSARDRDQFGELDRYLRSHWYRGDLAATKVMWSAPGTVEAAGCFVLLTYFASPELLAVRAPGVAASLRTAVDGHRERSFLEGVLGLGLEGRSVGGIGDGTVRRRVEDLRDRHFQYPGMTGTYMWLVAGLLAIAPLRLRAHYGEPAARVVGRRYWRYMTNVSRLLGIEFGSVLSAGRHCERLVESYAGPSIDGGTLISEFSQRHRRHVARALPVLFPAARRVVQQVLVGHEPVGTNKIQAVRTSST